MPVNICNLIAAGDLFSNSGTPKENNMRSVQNWHEMVLTLPEMEN